MKWELKINELKLFLPYTNLIVNLHSIPLRRINSTNIPISTINCKKLRGAMY